jgi:cystathionine beta-lyase
MHDETRLTTWDSDDGNGFRSLTPPVHHASTVLFPGMESFVGRRSQLYDGYWYGLYGTPTTLALERKIAELEGGTRSIALPSGLAAIAIVNMAFLAAGDHVLVADSVYGPTREFCDVVLARHGIETTYYDPLVGGGIAALFRPRTRLIWVESPGSLTFEVQDVPAIAAAAHEAGILVAADNTWATPLNFKPFRHGVDISVQAASKYIAGHSDVVMGFVTVANRDHFVRLKDATRAFGIGAAAGDCYLVIRGLMTLAVRLRQHEQAALRIAHWLADRPEVVRVLHPAFPAHPGHAAWARDFTGANGLFSIVLADCPHGAVRAMVDGMRHFRIGASWGGPQSLIAPSNPRASRTATTWTDTRPLLRLHVGLEDPDDLIADLDAGFARLSAAAVSPTHAAAAPAAR